MIKDIIKSGLRGVRRGFTLVELLIAMSIFMVFTGVLTNSYTSIVRSQREANEYRVMYSEARQVFDQIVDVTRNSVMNYNDVLDGTRLSLVDKDGEGGTIFTLDVAEGKVEMAGEPMNSDEVRVSDLRFDVFPILDPYDSENFTNDDVQFQPSVTIYAVFEKELRNGKVYSVDLRTTVSSRYYSVTPDQFE